MPQLKPRQSKSNPRQWFSSCSSSESPSSTLEKKREKARRTLSRDDPSYLEFLRSSEEQQRDRDLRRQGEPLAGIVEEKFEAVLKYQTALPSDGQVFPPVPPLQPTRALRVGIGWLCGTTSTSGGLEFQSGLSFGYIPTPTPDLSVFSLRPCLSPLH